MILLLALVLLSNSVAFPNTTEHNGSSARGIIDVSRSLTKLIPAVPTPEGSSYYESTGGVHPIKLCHLGMVPPHTSVDGQQFYCHYREGDDEPIKYISLRPLFDLNSPSVGVFAACPDERAKCREMNITGLSLDSCLESCSDPVSEGNDCSERTRCPSGLFCQRTPGNATGFCNECPLEVEIERCLEEKDMFSRERCLQCYPRCKFYSWADVTVDDRSIWAFAPGSKSPPNTREVIAPIVDCSDLASNEVKLCPAANNSICIGNVNSIYKDPKLLPEIVNKCEKSGGLATLVYYSSDYKMVSSDDVPEVTFVPAPLKIPLAIISYNEGVAIKQSKLGSLANVTLYDSGTFCASSNAYCSEAIPCTNENQYCRFVSRGERGAGCFPCPDDPLDCYFKMDIGEGTGTKNVAACSTKCSASVEFGRACKTCGDTITGFEFGVDDPTDRCEFCPKDDMKYPDRIVPFFSVGETKIQCRQVQSFFDKIDVDKGTGNCLLSQLQNYICGCEGAGYAGANTVTKQRALVWMPRVSALLSIMGSLFIILDILRRGSRRQEVYNQIMLCISVFDMIGSTAYAFTSAPIPTEYYYEGAYGNDATCTAQGFFIQVGTVAAYTNVSLAFYYFLAIRKGLNEAQLQSYRLRFLLCPIILGLAFAFAGLSYYGNVFLWCNNTALWWPDIPIAVAIFVATIVMGVVCYDVHKKVQAFKREQQRGEGNTATLSTKVFWQSFWYLLGFYMTWVPYLALQYSWSAGTAFTHYCFILFAGTAVPLQGMWNCFNYARTRQLRHARELFSNLASSLSLSRRQTNLAGNTEQVTAAASTVVPQMSTRSLLDNYDDELLTFFSSSSTPNDIVYDPNYWISSNESLPVPPGHFPILNSSVMIPDGNALLIAERIKKVLRDRSIVASFDSRGAKADCFTKENVTFRIRLYRTTGLIDTIIVEVQRLDGFDLVFQTDTLAVLSAAKGRDYVDPGLNETFVYFKTVISMILTKSIRGNHLTL